MKPKQAILPEKASTTKGSKGATATQDLTIKSSKLLKAQPVRKLRVILPYVDTENGGISRLVLPESGPDIIAQSYAVFTITIYGDGSAWLANTAEDAELGGLAVYQT